MIKVSDSVGRLHQLNSIVNIVSLVPSWTEYLAFLGLQNKIVGRTKFCIFPEDIVEDIPKIGGTKNPDIKQIINLNPDFVIANKEENKLVDINRLRAENITVFTTFAIRVVEALDEMEQIELILTGKTDKSKKISEESVKHFTKSSNYSFIYLIWKKPYMCAGQGTYINQLIESVGGKNLISETEERYPKISLMELRNLNPDKIFLPDEPYNFHINDREELHEYFSEDQLILVDGTLASWYNQRIVKGLQFYETI